jgi:hypothetical protein
VKGATANSKRESDQCFGVLGCLFVEKRMLKYLSDSEKFSFDHGLIRLSD